jgi:hypothetical protein
MKLLGSKLMLGLAAFPVWCGVLAASTLCTSAPGPAPAAAALPGTGRRVADFGDDFEDPEWLFVPNLPKSSNNLDRQTRLPGGASNNERWFEGAYRGLPDVVQRIATPPGGIPGSTGALLLRSLHTGIPGRPSRKIQQDDIIMGSSPSLGDQVPVSRAPNVVVRIYLPPFEQWDPVSDATFAFRASVQATVTKRGLFGGGKKLETYWPGVFIFFHSKSQGYDRDSVQLVLRADNNGQDFLGPEITEPGWWTFGMSFTSDGKVHYYASPGVDDLTEADHLATQNPYGWRCEYFHTVFFNVINQDNGRSWSTPWVIDDPAMYVQR